MFLPIIRRRGSSFVLYPSVDGNGGEEGDTVCWLGLNKWAVQDDSGSCSKGCVNVLKIRFE